MIKLVIIAQSLKYPVKLWPNLQTLLFNEHGSAEFPECGLFAYALQLNCSLAYSVAGCYLRGYSKIQSNRCVGHADSSNGSELLTACSNPQYVIQLQLTTEDGHFGSALLPAADV